MKKFLALLILIIVISPLSFFGMGNFSVEKANAMVIDTSKLQYFELKEPVSVCRDNDSIYIAEKKQIIIYHHETYDTISFDDFEISHIEKVGNNLFILSKNSLYVMDIKSHKHNLLSYMDGENKVELNNIASFATRNNKLAITTNDLQIIYFNIILSPQFKIEKIADYQSKTLWASTTMALKEDNNLFYFIPESKIIKIYTPSNHGHIDYTTIELDNIEQLTYADKLYYKANNTICSISNDNGHISQTILNLSDYNISKSGDIFISDGKMLICDTLANRICEYDLNLKQMTDFEISFNKIFLPENFKINLVENPRYIDIATGTTLYDIDLEKSLSGKYFKFNGYHGQQESANYLILSEVGENYYLIAGDCIALVLKDERPVTTIEKQSVNKEKYISNNAKTYLAPYLASEIVNFNLKKHEKVNVVSTVNFRNVNYSLIKKGDKLGYIPSSFVLDSIYTPPVLDNYRASTTYNRTAIVYQDINFAHQCDKLSPYTNIIISEEFKDGYKIKYGENKVGYIKKNVIKKRGDLTKKIVTVVIICAFSLTITGIYLEIKYLYKKDNGERKSKNK